MTTRQRVAERSVAIRARLKDQAAQRVRRWVFGHETNFPGDPRRRLDAHETSWAPIRLIQFAADDGEPVRVGKYSGIHHTVTAFHGGVHQIDHVGVAHVRLANGQIFVPPDLVTSNGPITIGCDVWIAFEALIMSGVTIGDGAVIAARTVVTKNVEPYSIVGGNPGRHIRYRFDEPTRQALLRIRWWDWPEDKIARHRGEIDSDDVAGFVERHDPARNSG